MKGELTVNTWQSVGVLNGKCVGPVEWTQVQASVQVSRAAQALQAPRKVKWSRLPRSWADDLRVSSTGIALDSG